MEVLEYIVCGNTFRVTESKTYFQFLVQALSEDLPLVPLINDQTEIVPLPHTLMPTREASGEMNL